MTMQNAFGTLAGQQVRIKIRATYGTDPWTEQGVVKHVGAELVQIQHPDAAEPVYVPYSAIASFKLLP